MSAVNGNRSEARVEKHKEPLNALIAYGTVGNTTALIGEAIAEGLNSASASASAIEINLLKIMMPKRIEEINSQVDLLGIGSPVYFLREAPYVADFISGLPSLEGKKAFVYCTCGMSRIGETLQRLQASLAERGAIVVGAQHFSSAMSYPPYRKHGFGNPKHMPDETVLMAARGFGERMARALELAPIPMQSAHLGTRLKAKMLASKTLRRALFPAVEVKRDVCTGYGSCISRCPFHGLERKDDEEIPFVTNSCIQCLQCIDFCPKAAIASDDPVREWFSTLSYRMGLH